MRKLSHLYKFDMWEKQCKLFKKNRVIPPPHFRLVSWKLLSIGI